MIEIREALAIIAREASPADTESVALGSSVGRILASAIIADLDLPPFDRSQMDGFAVRSVDCFDPGSRLEIIGESIAGKGFNGSVDSGQAVRIMTGARVPKGADAVQQVEKTTGDNGFVIIGEPVATGQNMVLRGKETRIGDVIFHPGRIVTDKMIAALASFGCTEILAAKRPSVTLMATGSEIVGIGETPGPDQIRNSNSAMLSSFLETLGIEPRESPSVGDDLESLTRSIESILKDEPDILIMTGGVSVGDYDFSKEAMRRAGAEIFFERVSLKPGKPTVFARAGKTLIFGLPGNPVSVAVTFFLFVRFAILMMQGAANPELRRGTAIAAGPIKGARERDCLLPVSLATDKSGRLLIESVRFAGSSNFIAFAAAEALVFIPKATAIGAGDTAEIYWLP